MLLRVRLKTVTQPDPRSTQEATYKVPNKMFIVCLHLVR